MSELNKLKYRCSELEMRIEKLEGVIDDLHFSMETQRNRIFSCGQCGADPRQIDFGGCSSNDCPHGLNESET